MDLEVFYFYVERIGAVIGLVGIVLAGINHIGNWIFNILSAILYAIFFYEANLYSDAGLQFVFIGMSVYGWANWNKDNKLPKKSRQLSYLTRDEILQSVVITLLVWRVWYWILPQIKPEQEFLFLDTITTCISITAVILQAKHKIDCWIWWLIVNAIYVPLFLYRGYHFTGILYFIFIVLSVVGFVKWRNMEKLS